MSSSRVHVVIFPFVLRHMDFSFLSYEHMIFFPSIQSYDSPLCFFQYKICCYEKQQRSTYTSISNECRTKKKHSLFFDGERNLEGFFSYSVLSHAVVEDSKTGIIYITKYIISGTRPR